MPRQAALWNGGGEMNPAWLANRVMRQGDGCWLWTKYRNEGGYGRARVAGGTHLAHRIAWMIFRGAIPAGMIVCHKCDNPPCCNPDHLFLGTHADNSADKRAKGRDRHPAGEKHPQSKLTEREVIAIRASAKSLKALALEYGMSKSMMHNIRTGANWAHIK